MIGKHYIPFLGAVCTLHDMIFPMKIVLKILVVALTLMVLPRFIPAISVTGFQTALVASLVFGVLNLLIKPIIKIVTLPINMVTLGLFGVVVNGALLWCVGYFVPGFSVATFTAAILGALVLSIVNWIAHFA